MIQSKESSESVTATRNAARSSVFMVMLYGLACFPSFVYTFKHGVLSGVGIGDRWSASVEVFWLQVVRCEYLNAPWL